MMSGFIGRVLRPWDGDRPLSRIIFNIGMIAIFFRQAYLSPDNLWQAWWRSVGWSLVWLVAFSAALVAVDVFKEWKKSRVA